MENQDNILIRKYNENDREEVRRISCDTAFLGEPRENFFDDDEIIADALTLYFTDYEPDSCFVVVEGDRVIGYIIGTKDVPTMRRILKKQIIPQLLKSAIRRGVLWRRVNRGFLINLLISFLKGEFSVPDFSKVYPATLHIDIDERYRGRRIGASLIDYYINFLKENKVEGIHFATISENAKMFFTRLGFNLLFEKKQSYLKYYLGKDLLYSVFGKTL